MLTQLLNSPTDSINATSMNGRATYTTPYGRNRPATSVNKGQVRKSLPTDVSASRNYENAGSGISMATQSLSGPDTATGSYMQPNRRNGNCASCNQNIPAKVTNATQQAMNYYNGMRG